MKSFCHFSSAVIMVYKQAFSVNKERSALALETMLCLTVASALVFYLILRNLPSFI